MTIDIDDCVAFAERELTSGRFQHSLGVMQVMGELASVYKLDETAALTCGILHDAAKELPLARQLEMAEKNNISLRTHFDKYPLFLHGPVGACYVADELGVSDPMVLDAILNHSYFGEGTALSPLLCWCLRFADVLEPSRDWQDLQSQLRPLVYSGHVQQGAYMLMKWMIPFHESGSTPVHPNMHRVFRELSSLMEQKDSFAGDVLPV